MTSHRTGPLGDLETVVDEMVVVARANSATKWTHIARFMRLTVVVLFDLDKRVRRIEDNRRG